MSDTERIATALLGWVHKGKHPKGDCFQAARPAGQIGVETAYVDRKTGDSMGCDFDGPWPDFTTLDGCRLFEDALDRRGLLGAYIGKLENVVYEETGISLWNICRATPAQRVAACIRVLDEINKEK